MIFLIMMIDSFMEGEKGVESKLSELQRYKQIYSWTSWLYWKRDGTLVATFLPGTMKESKRMVERMVADEEQGLGKGYLLQYNL